MNQQFSDLSGKSFDGFTVEVDEARQRGDIILDRGEYNTISMGQRRKLHLGLDLVSSQIGCSELTPDDVRDPTALPSLLDQVVGRADLFWRMVLTMPVRCPGTGSGFGRLLLLGACGALVSWAGLVP